MFDLMEEEPAKKTSFRGNSKCKGSVAAKNLKNATFLLILQNYLLDFPPYGCDWDTDKK